MARGGLRSLKRELSMVDLDTPSMGTSDDSDVAIKEGVTSERIGPTTFGHLAEQPSA
jgi:uncharacterized pyridoxal phosphate-containing UPF0001 family protein